MMLYIYTYTQAADVGVAQRAAGGAVPRARARVVPQGAADSVLLGADHPLSQRALVGFNAHADGGSP